MKKPNLNKKYKNYMEKSIALIGHMGSGKSIIGKLIAKELKIKHFDSDILIEKKTNKTIKEIFEKEGEPNFRKIEENIILNLKFDNKFVVSLGGGAIVSKKTRNFLKTHFITLFLDIDISVLVSRLRYSKKRPLLLNENVKDKLIELDKIRRQFYLQADIVIKNNDDKEGLLKKFFEEYKKLNEKNN